MQMNVASPEDVTTWREQAHAVHLDDKVKRYIVAVVNATRAAHPHVHYGASPRASLALAFTARARALIDGRDFVLPDDVRTLAPLVLTHRIAFTHRLAVEKASPQTFVANAVASVPAP